MTTAPMARTSVRLRVVAALAAASFVAHGVSHVLRGNAVELMWMCNIAPLILVIGCLAESAGWVTVAVEWLSFGTPIWLIDVLNGGELIPTSLGPHVVCPIAGIVALREVGVRKKSWIVATALGLLLVGLTRLVTPPHYNINVAFYVWKAWEHRFSSYPPYFAFMLACMAATFLVFELILLRFIGGGRTPLAEKDTHDQSDLRTVAAQAARRRG
jgi:hypothetical protein